MEPLTPSTPSRPDDPAVGGHERVPRPATLRLGVFLNSFTVPTWIGKLLDDVARSGIAELSLVVLNTEPRQSVWERLRDQRHHLLYLAYLRADRALVRWLLSLEKDAFDPVDLTSLLRDVPTMKVVPIRSSRFVHRFDEASLQRLREADLDVILSFGFRILKGEVLQAARYGIWSFHHGDNREYRGGPPMFWEMYENNPLAGVTLQVLTEQLDGGQVLYRSVSKTNEFSLHLNRNANYWKGSEFVVRRLRDLYERGWEQVSAIDTFSETSDYAKPIYKMPTNRTMARFIGRLGARWTQRAVRDLTTEESWFLAWRRRGAGDGPGLTGHGSFRTLMPPAGTFYADPFLLRRNGTTYVFFEDFSYRVRRAVISCVALGPDGTPSRPWVVIDTGKHLSYPFAFEHEGQVYLMPEARSRRRIELWHATDFPKWFERHSILLDNVNAVDPTLVFHQGRWWLFAGIAVEGASTCDELHAFVADSPFGPFRPHRMNPLVSDVRSARPAGVMFERNGVLYRPGQDSSLGYGYRVVIHRVDELSETRYHETPVATIEPSWYEGNEGTHTFNFNEDFEVLDGRIRARRGPFARFGNHGR